MQRGALRHVPLIDSSVHRRRILVQPGLDVLTQVEAHRVMEIDRAVHTQPVEDLLFVVLRPRERSRVERIVAVADVGTRRDKTLHHLDIALPGRAMERRAVVDADHVPVAVLRQQKVDGLALSAHVRIEQREPIASRSGISLPSRRGRASSRPSRSKKSRSRSIRAKRRRG